MTSTSAASAEPTSRKVSRACISCQNRKSKCTGGVPCHKCRARGTECIVDESTDGRRKLALRRKQQEWEDDKTLLTQMLEALRDNDESYVQQLISIVRSDASSLEDIRHFVHERTHVHEAGPSAFMDAISVSMQAEGSRRSSARDVSSQRSVMGMHRLIDSPIISVTAEPWTVVTDDNHLVSHLVSMWFTWSAPWQNWIDQKLFVQDMVSRNVNAQYCSPFLVNAMLAHTCPYSDYPEVKGSVHGMSAMMREFLAEAKRLLDQEAGRARLTTLQGLGILYHSVASTGKDRQSWTYLRQIADMISDLQRTSNFADHKLEEPMTTSDQALAYTWWGLWIATTTSCLIWHRLPVMDMPTCPMPELATHETQPDSWLPYPDVEPVVYGHAACLFDAYSDLMPIVADTIDTVLVSHGTSSYSDLENSIFQLNHRLEAWYQNLPCCLAVSKGVPFQILFPHYYYHYMTIILSSCLKSTFLPPMTSVENLRHRTTTQALRTGSALQISRLLKLQCETCSSLRICDSTVNWAAIAMFTLLDEDLHIDAHKTAFVRLCEFLWSVGQRWPLSKNILRLVQVTAMRKQANMPYPFLPSEAEELFRKFDYLWRASGLPISISDEISSFYPNFAEFVQGFKEQHGMVHPLMGSIDPYNFSTQPNRGHERIVEMDKFLDMYDPATMQLTDLEVTDNFEGSVADSVAMGVSWGRPHVPPLREG